MWYCNVKYVIDACYLEFFFFLMIRRPPRSTLSSSSAASDVYKRQDSMVLMLPRKCTKMVHTVAPIWIYTLIARTSVRAQSFKVLAAALPTRLRQWEVNR
eukprot:TRINITY_DN25060_c0_g1_i1.p2 TRINITY_DN25060_c0_g1~~TRINITY_DN25060_c0_g1_i1.p2  ORF type:complete len:100 (+),score=24.60 TRINITY_DN25060_c0_g1_i1:58-357(+)